MIPIFGSGALHVKKKCKLFFTTFAKGDQKHSQPKSKRCLLSCIILYKPQEFSLEQEDLAIGKGANNNTSYLAENQIEVRLFV